MCIAVVNKKKRSDSEILSLNQVIFRLGTLYKSTVMANKIFHILDLRPDPASGTFLSSQIVTPSQEHIFFSEFWKSPADLAMIPQESLEKIYI